MTLQNVPSQTPGVRLRHFAGAPDEPIFCTTSLRTRACVFRHINYGSLVVDERLLNPSFPYVANPSTQWAIVVLRGNLELFDDPPTLAREGEGLHFGTSGKKNARWTACEFIELEWRTPGHQRPPSAVPLKLADLTLAREVAEALDDDACPALRTVDLGIELFQSAGVSLASVDTTPVEPEAADLLLAKALQAQINDLKDSATTTSLGDATGLSARQLQRVTKQFCERYGVNADGWRDMRNRCRVQLAAFMLSLPHLSVSRIARDVGYSSVNALTRAFADHGLPAPARFRRLVLQGADVR